jgi:hypothetical protein
LFTGNGGVAASKDTRPKRCDRRECELGIGGELFGIRNAAIIQEAISTGVPIARLSSRSAHP